MTRNIAIFLTTVLLFHLPALLSAQTNSWTNATSANWADPYWSLGVLPTTNQDIMLTNEGWKAVAIDPNTAQDFPETMTVSSITISSPSNSYNTLLLNYSGTESPLTAQYIVLESNSAITMLSSALLLDGPNGTMELGGEFNQTNSIVNANQIDVGSLGPATYNMDSGVLNVSKLWVRGGFNGVFNQSGGTNNAAIAGFYAGGTYNLSGGDFNATVYFNNGEFHQTGGSIDQPLTNIQGTYLLDGGINYGGVVSGSVVQTGGTNFGGFGSSSYGGDPLPGAYVLSNGCFFLSNFDIGPACGFDQFGGLQIITNTLSLEWGGSYTLNDGTLLAGGMVISNIYSQGGGTNLVAGDITVLDGFYPRAELSGGLLTADDITLKYGALLQYGGCLVANNLTTYGYGTGKIDWYGPNINYTEGQLIVSNITVYDDNFGISATNLIQTGTLTLGSGELLTGAGAYTFGPLNVQNDFFTYGGGQSIILLETNVSCQIHFADSSGVSWGNFLEIRSWTGSIYGGGSQQIFFGSNSAALTAQQLSDIQFVSPPGMPPGNPPGGLPPGLYPARILATGEIVPDSGAPLPLQMAVGGSSSNGEMPLTIAGDIGRNYEVDVSTDLVNWSSWMDMSNSTGTISITDCEATNFPQRFYRVRVLP